jgi:hypothetical protein
LIQAGSGEEHRTEGTGEGMASDGGYGVIVTAPVLPVLAGFRMRRQLGVRTAPSYRRMGLAP